MMYILNPARINFSKIFYKNTFYSRLWLVWAFTLNFDGVSNLFLIIKILCLCQSFKNLLFDSIFFLLGLSPIVN